MMSKEVIKNYTKEEKVIKDLLSDLEEIILSVLSGQKELYGLQITKAIEHGSHGKVHVGFGSLYPALRRLEGKKFVESHWENENSEDRGGARRRYYKISALGSEALEEKRTIRQNIISYRIASV